MADHLRLPPPTPVFSRRTSGGGSERTVDRASHGAVVSARVRAAVEQAEGFDEDNEEESVDVLALKLSTAGRTSLGGLKRLEMDVLGEDEDWNYYVLTNSESRNRFLDLLEEYSELPSGSVDWEHPKAWAGLIDNIEDVELYGPEDRADESLAELNFESPTEVECLIWPAQFKNTARARIQRVRAALAETADGAEVLDENARPDWLVVRVSVDRDGLNALLREGVVQKVVAPPTTSFTAEAAAAASLPEDMPNPTEARMGVVDGIVSAGNPFVGPFVADAQDFPTGHPYPVPDEHGTRVAGVAVWGDLDGFVTGRGDLPTPVTILSARVLELETPTSTRVAGNTLRTIEEAIRWLASEGVRIISMSINYRSAADLPSRMPLTYLVDQLTRELGVVIVVSTGNFDPTQHGMHVFNDYPDYLATSAAGVAAPGDAAIAVTVGAHARRDTVAVSSPTAWPIAKSGEPAHFTRTGAQLSGRIARRKPEFVAHGGNGVWDTSTSQLLVNEPGTSVVVPSFSPAAGPLGFDNGTSFAAPAVAHEIALIAERYPDAGQNLLRALTALSARQEVHTPDPGTLPDERVSAYGVPLAERILESDTERVVLTFEGSIDTNTTVVHAIPIPPEFAEVINTQDFRVALAFDPPVRRTRREYIAGKMQFELVRGLSEGEVIEIYARQPTQTEIDEDPILAKRALPDRDLRPNLSPPVGTLSSNTLICRGYNRGDWDTQHGSYYLVVTHMHNPSTPAQRRDYSEQTYSAVVELRLHDRPEIDLYALVRARLRARGRAAGRV